jgi:hypothetical protein
MSDYRQHSKAHIPGFKDAPEWAEWVQFCTQRGWVFYNKRPHVFPDGVASSQLDNAGYNGLKYIKASDTDNVVYLSNPKGYTGKSRPWPEDMP